MTKWSKWFRAYTNIALIKYWGKSDQALMIPQNNSLSLTLDAFFTETRVSFDSAYTEDQLILDNELQDTKSVKKAQKILDYVRKIADINDFAKIESRNFVPTAAGLASSASGMAALAAAASDALGLDLSDQALSSLARLGSGSACRSIYGGFVEWEKGFDHESSRAIPIDEANWDLGMIFIIVEDAKKEVSSTEGMQRVVDTSPYYPGWLSSTANDLKEIKIAIDQQDFVKMGQIAESSALKMHALNFSANPPFNYWTADSIDAMNAVKNLRKQEHDAYFTMDAGPNVKVLCRKSEIENLSAILHETLPHAKLVQAFPGPGITALEGVDHG